MVVDGRCQDIAQVPGRGNASAQVGIMFAFTILTETVFQWQGMGFMFLEAVERSDISLLVAYLMVVGAVFVVVNTLVDIIYGLVNPTIRIAGRQ